MAFLADEGVTAVNVTFDRFGKQYMYKTNLKGIKEGDIVLVPSGSTHFDHNGSRLPIGTAEVVEIDAEVDYDSTIPLKWLVGKVDLSHYDQTLAADEKLMTQVVKVEKEVKKRQLKEALRLSLGADDLLELSFSFNPNEETQNA